MTMSINRISSARESRPAALVLTVIFITPKINLANPKGVLTWFVSLCFSTKDF